MPHTNGSYPMDQRVSKKIDDLDAIIRSEEGKTPTSGPSPLSKKPTLLHKLLSYPPKGSLTIRPTSWLDGVRGVAALSVYIFHALGLWDHVVPAWHSDASQNSILQMPLVRTITDSGGAAVSVFFALSGYVLTQKSLRWMRDGTPHHVYPAVASSMFRRGFRLYIPPVIMSFCQMLATRVGFAPPLNFDFVPEETLALQFRHWLRDMNRFMNPMENFKHAMLGELVHTEYDIVTWTIPIEFYGSFVCYVLILLLARAPGNAVRMLVLGWNMVFFMWVGSWNNFCFLAGMLIADIHLSQEVNGHFRPSRHPLIWSLLFTLSFYTAGFPTLMFPSALTSPMPGFEMLRALTPFFLPLQDHARFWWSLSGIALLFSISQLPAVKSRIFESYFCQHLGRIAFSLYLVHEFCIVLFGLPMQVLLFKIGGVHARGLEPPEHSVVYWCLCGVWFVVFTGCVFVVAGVFERAIDRPSVRFARWLEERCFGVLKGR